MPLIVFITAYDRFAVDVFEQEAIDYLLKPLEENRLKKTLQRVQSRLSQNASELAAVNGISSSELVSALITKLQPQETPHKLTWIKATRLDSVYLIAPEDVYYFQADDKYTTVITVDSTYLIRTSVIKELKTQLDSRIFLQIHRGTLVNSTHIEKVNRELGGRMYVYLKSPKKKLLVSRNFSNLFKQM